MSVTMVRCALEQKVRADYFFCALNRKLRRRGDGRQQKTCYRDVFANNGQSVMMTRGVACAL